MATRRQFIKTGFAGGALLSLAYVLHPTLDRWGRRALRDQAQVADALRLVVGAVAPVMLAGALPVAADERQASLMRVSDGVATAISKLGATTQLELAELFALLALAPTRIMVAGVRSPWAEAKDEQISAFLDGWRNSSLDLMKTGYLALHDLIFGAWYADPANWPAISYPGPPRVERQ